MAWRLARAQGYPDGDWLLERMDAAVLHEWMEFASIEPWGFVADDLNTARIVYAVVASMGGAKGLNLEDLTLADKLGRPPTQEFDGADTLKIRAVLGLPGTP